MDIRDDLREGGLLASHLAGLLNRADEEIDRLRQELAVQRDQLQEAADREIRRLEEIERLTRELDEERERAEENFFERLRAAESERGAP